MLRYCKSSYSAWTPIKWRINRNRRAAACVVCRASRIPGDRASSRIQSRKHGIKSVLLLITFSLSFSDSLRKKTGQGDTTGTSFLPPAIQYVSQALSFHSLKWDRAPVIKFRGYQLMRTHKANLLELHRYSNYLAFLDFEHLILWIWCSPDLIFQVSVLWKVITFNR